MNEKNAKQEEGPIRSPGNRLVALVTGVGLAIAASALAAIGVFGGSSSLFTLFWCGWAAIGIAMLAGLFTLRSPLPIANPLKVIRFGLVTVILGFSMELLSGAPMKPLWGFGAFTMLVGIGWALWNIGELRK